MNKEILPLPRPPALEPVHGANRRASIPMTPLSQNASFGLGSVSHVQKTRNLKKNLKEQKLLAKFAKKEKIEMKPEKLTKKESKNSAYLVQSAYISALSIPIL